MIIRLLLLAFIVLAPLSSYSSSEDELLITGSSTDKYEIGTALVESDEIELRAGEYITLYNAKTGSSKRFEGVYQGRIDEYDASKQARRKSILDKVLNDPVANCGDKLLGIRGECEEIQDQNK